MTLLSCDNLPSNGATLRGLAESREIVWLYDRWFVRPLPSGERIGLPMGTQLRRSLELLGLPPM